MDNMNEHIRQALKPYYFLPLFYMIPKEHLAVRKLDKFPRNPLIAVSTPKWRRLYRTKGWQAEVAEVWAYMMWPHMGIRGMLSHYTINEPFVQMLYSLALWAWLFSLQGINTDLLASFPPDTALPYITVEQAENNCRLMAKSFWGHPYLKAKGCMEIVQHHRAHADFAKRRTSVHIDFLRKYYHTRTRYKQVALQDAGGAHEEIPDSDFAMEDIITSLWMEQFFRRLKNDKDVTICKLLYIGCTQAQIAARLGYANHSGINKRIAKIRRKLQEFLDLQAEWETAKIVKKRKTGSVQYDVIPFAYKRKILLESRTI